MMQIPLRTHRYDESDRVFLAGCSSAEPASASSMRSAYQSHAACSVSGPPAGPHVVRDCARELTLPIHPIVCFEVGWFTLTQSSRTKLHRSRKWMSGHAATALVTRRIEDSSEPHRANRSIDRGKPFLQVKGNLRFPLTVTYHGCPETPSHLGRVPNQRHVYVDASRRDERKIFSPFVEDHAGRVAVQSKVVD
jgi:hypothetical protein